MALTLIVEDGTGKADANSYATVDEAVAYYYGHRWATSFFGATADQKAEALVMATRVIDAEIAFHGQKKTGAQALQWPREGCPEPDRPADGDGFVPHDAVPRRVKEACCEMAQELIRVDRTNSYDGEGLYSKQTAADVITVYSKRDIRPILSRLAIAMLGRYGVAVGSKSGMIKLQRV